MKQSHSKKEIALCKKLNVPLPKLQPQERLREIMATRNEWKLYRRKCDFTGEEIISAYDADTPFPVYKNEIWWGDEWEALDYGRDFDFNRPFFEQFAELQKVVPREGTTVFNSKNCDYNSHIRESKNCYLSSLVHKCEDLYYSYWMVNDQDVFDSMYTNDSTRSYNCSNVNDGYECINLEESTNCSNCHFSYQLIGCSNCIFCSNLANKSYHINNKPCTKDQFEKEKARILDGTLKSFKKAQQHFQKIKAESPQRYVHNLNCINCIGDHLYNCKNCTNCFESFDSEDCINSISLSGSRDCHNCYSAGWPGCDRVHYSGVSRGSTDIAFCNYTWFSSNLRYCDSSNACHDCFGCIGLRHKKYCILNKQYSKEEYKKLLPKIIDHMTKTDEWGQFFPPELSVYAYNETAAQDFFPLEKEQAISLGWRWKDKLDSAEKQQTTQAQKCATCQKPYRIIPQEQKFYDLMNLPAPDACPQCRHKERFSRKPPLSLFAQSCTKCSAAIKTPYSSDRPETVYCEKCYLEEVY